MLITCVISSSIGKKSIGALVTNGLPDMKQDLSASSSHIHHDLPDVRCYEREFGLIGPNVNELIKKKGESSSFLSYINEQTEVEYNSESCVETMISIYLKDLLIGMGLDTVKIYKGIEVLRLKPDIWLLSHNKVPFLIIEVKKPGQNILEHEKVVSQLAQYMHMLRNYHGIRHVFGILATMEHFRVAWLPGCQPVAESSELYSEDVPDETDHDCVLYGTRVLSGKDTSTHHFIASAIAKAYNGLGVVAQHRLPLPQRVVFRVDAINLVWARLLKKVDRLNVAPFRSCSNYYLLKDLHHGAQGRTWLAVTATSHTVVVLKLGTAVRRKRYRGADNPSLMFEDEHKLWVKMGFDAKTVSLRESATLVMPYAIGCKRADTGAYIWDTAAWDDMRCMFSAEDCAAVESALQQVTPRQGLVQAIQGLIKKGVWHQDLEYRHLGLFPTVKNGIHIRYSFFDYGKAELISKTNRAAAVKQMEEDMQRLLNEEGEPAGAR